MTSSLQKKCSVASVVLFVALPLLSPARAGAGKAERWRLALREIDSHLREARYDEAQRQSKKLTANMVQGLGRGEGAAYSLAVANVFRALAEAGLGNTDDARWYWWTAWNLFKDITLTDLSPYGAPGEYVGGLKFRQRQGWENILPGFGETPPRDVVPPKVRSSKRPVFPDAARTHTLHGTYAAQVVVDIDGSVADPLLLRPATDPSLAYVVLDTLRAWKFKPATRKGEPVVSVYTLTVNFRFR